MDWIDLAQDRDRWGGLLWMRLRNFGFHKMRGIFWLDEELLASQVGLCPVDLGSLRAGRPNNIRLIFGWGKKTSSERRDWMWGPSSLLNVGAGGVSLGVKSPRHLFASSVEVKREW